jgi:hypothetical protein
LDWEEEAGAVGRGLRRRLEEEEEDEGGATVGGIHSGCRCSM